MKRGIALIVVAGLLFVAVMVVAQQTKQPKTAGVMGAGPAAPGMMKGDCWALGPGMAEALKKQLNLSDSQAASLQAIRKDFMDSTQSMRTDLATKRQQMAELWMADSPDPAAIKAQAADMDAMRAQMRDVAIDHAVRAVAVLTPAQRTQVRNWMQRNPQMMMGMGCGMCCGAGMCECPAIRMPAGRGPVMKPAPAKKTQ